MLIRNLGQVLTILARAECSEHFMHADLRAFNAPGECHTLVARGAVRRRRQARRHAEATARAPMRVIARQAKRRGLELGSFKWQEAVSRIYNKTYPF